MFPKSLKSSKGGGQTEVPSERKISVEDVALPEGYQIEAVAQGLTFPTGITFDEELGRIVAYLKALRKNDK